MMRPRGFIFKVPRRNKGASFQSLKFQSTRSQNSRSCRVTRCRGEFLGSHRYLICSIGDVFGGCTRFCVKFEVRFLFSIFAKVRTQEFRKSVWSWSEIFIRCKKKSMEVVWNTEALVQCGGAPGTLRILRVFARFQLNILRFFYAILRELRVSRVCGNKFKFSPL